MSSEAMLDIKEVVDRNVQYATLNDLQKKGKQRFKVMKLGQFYSLIDRAVANVIERRAFDLAETDRQAIVDESNREFKKLFQERQKELNELQAAKDEIQKLQGQLGTEQARREELERASTQHVQEMEHRLREEVGRVRAQAEVLQQGESQLRHEAQSKTTELQRATLELESERQRRIALEQAVQSAREHSDALGRDLESGLHQKDAEVQQLRSELQSTRETLLTEQGKVAEMDKVLRLAQERVETGSRNFQEAERARNQAEQTCRELEAQVQEARSEATAVARRAEEFEARATSMAAEKGALDQGTRKLQDEWAAAERGRVEALERVTALEAELRAVTEQLADARARLETAGALAQDRDRVINEKDQIIQELRAEGSRLSMERDQLRETSSAEESERARALRDGLTKLAEQLQSEKEQHQDTMKELLEETRAQKELFSEVRSLRAQLDETRTIEGNVLAGLGGRLGEIQKTLEEGVPGRPGSDVDLQEQIQAAIAVGMDTIKDQINLHVEGVNEKRRKEIELKAIEAAEVALDGLFLHKDDVESNAELVQVRQRQSGGISDNLAKLKALRATAPDEDTEGEDS